MDHWIPATNFIAADVIHWTEAIHDRRQRSKTLRWRGACFIHLRSSFWILTRTVIVAKPDIATPEDDKARLDLLIIEETHLFASHCPETVQNNDLSV